MKSIIETSSWKYIPEDRLGASKFDGLPCPTKKVLRIIGEGGVNEIDAIFKEIIEFKKKIYGVDSELLGFFPHVGFINKESKIMVACKESFYNFIDPKDLYAYPERATSDNYTLIFADELLGDHD